MAKAYIIQNKKTGVQFIASSGKRVWGGAGPAKNAYNQSHNYYRQDEHQKMPTHIVLSYGGKPCEVPLPYKDQDVWEVVCLDDKGDVSNKAINLLVQCCGRLTDGKLEREIKAFLEEQSE